ncbi:hypothetical protein SCHPADRAFT_269677 [Schizopora paradoxa]|uniref:F-box domain-containing protein n=1 Tax=Schizopora paradoxa TaxID=27342 RepID=A0A0H2RTI3_9AGAM|nr:hypothetical protein SCHPADRAFT_269677 [Schizopora paradoxa]
MNTLRLSHVCRHFRNIILSFPRFWNQIDIHPKSSGPLVEACLRYSQDIPLTIYLNVFCDTPEHFDYFNAFHQVLYQAHRWRKLTLRASPHCSAATQISLLEQFSWHARGGMQIMIGNRRFYPGLELKFSLPMLEELHVEKDASLPRSIIDIPAGRFLWDTPKLKFLKVSHYFPYTLPAISSITVFEFTISRRTFEYRSLLGALQRMSALEDLRIRFQNSEEEINGEEIGFDRVILGKVSRLKLCLETRHLFKPYRLSSQRAFYACLVLPNALELHFQFHAVSSHFLLSSRVSRTKILRERHGPNRLPSNPSPLSA